MILPYLAAVLLAIATAYSAVVSFRERPEGSVPTWIFPERTNRPARKFIGITTFILLIAAGAWLNINGVNPNAKNSAPRSFRFLIPEGYRGWVRVEFEIPGAPALPMEAGHAVLKIPPSGSLTTSSHEQYGWARDSYFVYSNSGMRPIPDTGPARLIWGKINGEEKGSSGIRKYEEFFVGTEREYKEQVEQAKPKER